MTGISLWRNPGPDAGWSWMIMPAALAVSILTYGFTNTGGAGVLYTEFIFIFDVTREKAMLPFSILNIAQSIAGLSSGLLNNVIPTRFLFLFSSVFCSMAFVLCFWANSVLYITCIFGIMFGLGSGLAHSLSSGMICEYFVKYRSTTTGLFSAGIPFGGLIYPMLVHYILLEYDLKSSMLLIGTAMLHLFIVSFIMRARSAKNFPVLKKTNESPKPSPNSLAKQLKKTNESPKPSPYSVAKELKKTYATPKHSPDSVAKELKKTNELPKPSPDSVVKHKKPEKEKSAFRNAVKIYVDTLKLPMFYVVTFQATISIHTLVGVSLTLIDYLADNRIERSTGVTMLTVLSASDLVGRLSSGLFVDRCSKFVKPCYVATLAMFLLGAGSFGICCTSNTTALYVLIAMLAFSEGTATTLVSILYCEYCGLEKIFACLSYKIFVFGMLGALRSSVIGLCRDKFGSYTYFYIVLGCSAMISTTLWLLSACLKRRKTKVLVIKH